MVGVPRCVLNSEDGLDSLASSHCIGILIFPMSTVGT